jgi:hypothetical protein
VTVELTFDLALELKFLVTHQLPLELKQVIGEQKNEVYSSLSNDKGAPRRLVGSRTFKLKDGNTFIVFFASDRRKPSSENQPLRVTHIEKV